MADEGNEEPHDNDNPEDSANTEPQPEFRMELRDSLPGGRAVVGVEQEGGILWLASKEYVHPKAVGEFIENMGRLVRERAWVQNWQGR